MHRSVSDGWEHTVPVMLKVDRVVAPQRHAFDSIMLLHCLQQSLRLFHLLFLVKDIGDLLGLGWEELLNVDGWHGAWNNETGMTILGLVSTKGHSRLLHLLELRFRVDHVVDDFWVLKILNQGCWSHIRTVRPLYSIQVLLGWTLSCLAAGRVLLRVANFIVVMVFDRTLWVSLLLLARWWQAGCRSYGFPWASCASLGETLPDQFVKVVVLNKRQCIWLSQFRFQYMAGCNKATVNFVDKY